MFRIVQCSMRVCDVMHSIDQCEEVCSELKQNVFRSYLSADMFLPHDK